MADIYSDLGYRIAPATINNREGYVPEFTPAETYKLRADGYYNQGDTALGDAYSALWNDSNAYSNTAKQINDFYGYLGSDIAGREALLAGVKSDLANKLFQDMSQSKQYVMDTFGPEGTLTTEINRYYDDLGNYLATEAGRQAATIAAQGMHSGASLGAIRAQQNQAYNETFARYVQAKEQEINAKQQIATNLINYMSTLRQEYGDTTNTYIISQYQRANDLLNSLSKSIADNNAQLASLRLTNSLSKGSSSNSTTSLIDGLIRGDITMDQIKQMYDNNNETNETNTNNNNNNNNSNYRTSNPANKGASGGGGSGW